MARKAKNLKVQPQRLSRTGALKNVRSDTYFEPKNFSQRRLIKSLLTNQIVFASGPAGCGKTYVAARFAIQKLLNGDITKIVITRPTVTVGEDIGFLPGDIGEKMEPWMMPFYDIFMEEGGITKIELQSMIRNGFIEICPLQFARGRTFRNCIVIADEMQNSEIEQLKMLMTRIGENAQFIITGDISQSDRRKKTKSGLVDFLDRLQDKRVEGIDLIKFSDEEIIRNPIITKILELYEE